MAEASSEEKTEAPSQKRRDDARKEGQVAFSKEVSSVALLGSFLLIFFFLGSMIIEAFEANFRHAFQNLSMSELNIPLIKEISEGNINNLIFVIIPFFIAAIVVGILSSVAQVGVNLTAKPLIPKLEKLNPFKGFGRIFSKQALSELFRSLFKMGVIGYIGYYTYDLYLEEVLNLLHTDSRNLIYYSAEIVGAFVFRVFLAFLILAIFDYMFQRWDLEQKLKMSKQEIKEEHKQTEGDPTLKARIRQVQQQLSQARMMQDVPESDVVISNPTHFAIAMKYDREYMSAPRVIAKGIDHIALRIIEVAGENDIMVYHNPSVARALYFQVEIGDDVPEEFYKAVAEILAFVYKNKKKTR
ncbi:flagellar biosynthesis protein FlhB [bacterium]|nr:flagellar biosynthesis protein FlhB [bacterium]